MTKAQKKTNSEVPVATSCAKCPLRKAGAFKWAGSTFELVDEKKLAGMVGHVAAVGGARPFI